MTTIGRRLRLVASATLAATALATLAPASAVVADRDRVYARNLPTMDDATASYPDLAGGTREVMRSRQTDVRTDDCLAWANGPRAAHGKWASFSDVKGSSPYFSGGVSPVVFVYKFSTRADTRAAMATIRSSVVDCLGEHTDGESTITSRMVDVPELGKARFGYRERQTNDGFDDRFLRVWVRTGRYLVESSAQRDSLTPGKKRLIKLTRATLTHIP